MLTLLEPNRCYRLETSTVKDLMMKLHTSGEDYLEAIFVLHREKGMLRSVDAARHTEGAKPSACVVVNKKRMAF